MQCLGRRPKEIGRKKEEVLQGTYLGVFLGFFASTMQGWPVVVQRLHAAAPSGKSHFICHRPPETKKPRVIDREHEMICVRSEAENVVVQGSNWPAVLFEFYHSRISRIPVRT